jgi:hypothetical protein
MRRRGSWIRAAPSKYPVVIPAKAGIHLDLASKSTMDPGLRRDDDQKQGVSIPGRVRRQISLVIPGPRWPQKYSSSFRGRPRCMRAEPGIGFDFASKITMDPGLRRDDEQKQGAAQKALGLGYRFATAFAEPVPDSIRELQTRTPKAARSASATDGASIPG